MKRLFCLMLALAMACALMTASAELADYLGEWYLIAMKVGEAAMDPSTLGMSMTMTVNEDGTVLNVTAYGDTAEEGRGTWELTADGLAVTDDTEMTLVFSINDAGELVADAEGMGMVFSREQPQVGALPNTIPAQSEDDMIGTWRLTTAAIGGMTIPAEMIGVGMTLTIEPGKMTMANDGDDGTVTELATTFTDGVLVGTANGEEVIVELNDNGTLSITSQLDEEAGMILYFEAVE